MTQPKRKIDRILEPGYLQDISVAAEDELRAKRDECAALEEEMSYGRRLLQGKLDILVKAAQERSAGGSTSAATLVSMLPTILADPESSRPSDSLIDKRHVEVAAPQFESQRREIDRLGGTSTDIEKYSEQELAAIIERLTQAEKQSSDQRRALLRVIDGINAELVKRYRQSSS